MISTWWILLALLAGFVAGLYAEHCAAKSVLRELRETSAECKRDAARAELLTAELNARLREYAEAKFGAGGSR